MLLQNSSTPHGAGTRRYVADRSVASHSRCPHTVRFAAAGSTGRRNTGTKSLCWGFKLQGLTRPFVELTSHLVQSGLRVHRQIGALRKVLSQQAVGVLVQSALPRALRIAKINVDVGRQCKATMIRKFFPRSQVRDLYSSFGSFFACLISAETTECVSLLASLANMPPSIAIRINRLRATHRALRSEMTKQLFLKHPAGLNK